MSKLSGPNTVLPGLLGSQAMDTKSGVGGSREAISTDWKHRGLLDPQRDLVGVFTLPRLDEVCACNPLSLGITSSSNNLYLHCSNGTLGPIGLPQVGTRGLDCSRFPSYKTGVSLTQSHILPAHLLISCIDDGYALRITSPSVGIRAYYQEHKSISDSRLHPSGIAVAISAQVNDDTHEVILYRFDNGSRQEGGLRITKERGIEPNSLPHRPSVAARATGLPPQTKLIFGCNGDVILSGDRTGVISAIDASNAIGQNGAEMPIIGRIELPSAHPVTAIAKSTDGKLLLVGQFDGSVHGVSLCYPKVQPGKKPTSLRVDMKLAFSTSLPYSVSAVTCNSDGSLIAAGDRGANLEVWQRGAGADLTSLSFIKAQEVGGYSALLFTEGSNRLITGCGERVEVWGE